MNLNSLERPYFLAITIHFQDVKCRSLRLASSFTRHYVSKGDIMPIRRLARSDSGALTGTLRYCKPPSGATTSVSHLSKGSFPTSLATRDKILKRNRNGLARKKPSWQEVTAWWHSISCSPCPFPPLSLDACLGNPVGGDAHGSRNQRCPTSSRHLDTQTKLGCFAHGFYSATYALCVHVTDLWSLKSK